MSEIAFARVPVDRQLEVRKREIVDDLKEMLQRYDFYQDETRRLLKDYEVLEAENERLKEQNKSLVLVRANEQWDNMRRSAMLRKQHRKFNHR